jgi:RNA polymerase sigma-70 factor (ECF subfamily)
MVSDEVLTQQVIHGNLSAFEELVERYKKLIFTIVYRIIGHYQDAEDITQEVFLTVFKKLYQFDSGKRFKPWIQRIAINTTITALRKKQKVINISYDENLEKDFDLNASSKIPDPQTEVEKQELHMEINSALQELNEGYRIILMLRYQMDLNNSEISDILNVSREIVEVRLHRARKALRKSVVERWTARGLEDGLPAIL